MPPRLTRVILMVRDVRRSAAFFRDGLRLRVESETESHARLVGEGEGASSVSIDVTRAQSEAERSVAYSPLLTFHVDDLDATLPRLLTAGGVLDGRVRRELYGASAAVRAPCGHMIGLFEEAPLPDGGADRLAAARAARGRLAAEEGADTSS